MKGRRKRILLLALIGLVTTVAVGVVWLLYGPLSFASAAARAKEAAALLRDNDPQRMLAEANRFYWGHNLPLAAPLYNRAQILFSQTHDSRDALYAQIGLMRTQDQTSFPDISAFIATQLTSPLVQHDPFLRLWCLGVKGDADMETNVGAAEEDWQQVMPLATSLGQKEWANRASGELGIVAFLRGDYRTAVGMIGSALISAALERDAGTEVRYLELVGNGLNGLDRASEGRYFLDRAIRIARHDGYVGTPFMAYEGRADALAAMGHRAQAVSLIEYTLATARQEKMWEHEGQDLLILGEFARHMGQPAQARAYLNEAGESAKRMGMCRVVAQSYFDLSELSKEAGDLKQATSETEQGVHYMSLAGDTVYLPHSLEALAALKAQAGQTDEAHQLYRQAEDVIDAMLLRAPGAYAESSLLNIMSDTYLGDFQLAAGEDNSAMAFAIIERARGRTVADMLTHHEADPRPKANETMAAKLASVQTEVLETSDSRRRNMLLDALDEDEAELGYLDALDPIAHTGTMHSPDLPIIQRSLQPDEAVLEYVLANPQSFCLAFDRNTVVIVRLPAGKKQLERLVSRYLATIASGQPGSVDAQRLYSLLLAPVPQSLLPQRLVIIPDGSLTNLPFDALQDGGGHYVIESHIVSYAPSARVLFDLRNRQAPQTPAMAFLGVGDVPYDYESTTTTKSGTLMHFLSRGVYDVSGAHLYDLPHSRQELIDADHALGQPQRSVLLMGKDATESRFASQPLGDFEVIHFAVHGLASPDFPQRSALILGRDPQGKRSGLLEVRDIAHLSLHADLVTLSACDTGTGKIEGEEGIAGLVPAFLFAGARSVVGSLWTVDDSATAIEMKQFYSHLGQGEDIAAALRQAKLDYIHMLGNRPPIFWAGFILVGDGARRISL